MDFLENLPKNIDSAKNYKISKFTYIISVDVSASLP